MTLTNIWDRERLLRSTILAGFAAAGLAISPAYAQDVIEEDEEEEASESEDRVVVTGSRVRRDSFTSTSPLQVIDEQTIQDAGLVDVGEILRSTSVVQGAQLDLQTNSQFISNAGPGGQAISLRGLASDRTLVLINGRRFAPAGVEGAPSFPDVSLIPSSLIQRVDILLDGASSVYGSDAIAGVTNIVLRDSFEGLQVGAFRTFTEGGGEQASFDFLMGGESADASFLFAAELVRNEELTGTDRDWMQRNGQFCSIDITANPDGTYTEVCGNDHAFQSGLGAFITSTGRIAGIYYGLPGISAADSDLGIAGFVNGRGNLVPAQGFSSAALNNARVLDAYEFPEFERATLFFTGTYDLNDTLAGAEFFIESSFSNRQTYFNTGPGQFTVDYNPDNPFNIFPGFGGSALLMTPWDVTIDVELDQWRVLSGVRGDLGFVDMPGWDYEVFVGNTRSQGYARRTGTLEENLNLSSQPVVDPVSGDITCGVPTPAGFFQSRTPENCVVINPFAETLYDPNNPRFSDDPLQNQLAIDWLRGYATITTFVDERIAGGFVTGPIFDGFDDEIQIVLGAEWREQTLDSRSSEVTARGLRLNAIKDRSSAGSVELWELYGEIVVPIFQGRTFAEDLTFEAAGRFVNHEFYGENSTWAAKLRWQPVDWLTIRGTAGTSFRAPNLRELFLGGQSGFASFQFDPCGVPLTAVAFDPVTGNPFYDPTGETRNATVIANCQAEGVDPFLLGVEGRSGFEAFRSGNPGLDPETSEAYSVGFVFDQPFTDLFDFSFGVNYFEIRVEDSILTPSAGSILSQCYNSANFPNDPFCTRRQRDFNAGGFLVEVDTTPFNVSSLTSEGIDYNYRFRTDFDLLGRNWGFTADGAITQTTELVQTISLGGQTSITDQVNYFGNPEWRATLNNRLEVGSTRFGELSFFHRARMVGEQDVIGALGLDPTTFDPNLFNAPSWWQHDLSATLQQDTWVFTVGIQNIADEDPVQVDEDADNGLGTNPGNLTTRAVPAGGGYDQIGRRFFLNVTKRF